MKKEILEKIDLLVEMSGSTNSYENLHEEFLTLTQEIDNKKNQLKNLKRNIGSSKYMKANEKVIDENIKIGMENRLDDLKESLEELLASIEKESLKEDNVHGKVVSLENDLNQLAKYIDSLNLKIKTSNAREHSYQNYQQLLDNAYQEKERVEKELKKAESDYAEITKTLSSLGTKRAEIENSISNDEAKLKEIEGKLSNPSTYIDKRAQKKDEDLVDSYTLELEELEKRKLEILTDPAYIGHEAQELYLDEDVTSALEKIKELVTIVEARPYMDVSSTMLDSLLAETEQKRDEFASEIENKKYDGSDLAILQTRISYLESEVTKCENEKKRIEEYVLEIDSKDVVELVSCVAEAKEARDLLKKDIEDYNKVLEDNKDMKSPKKRASLQAALKKKQEELAMVEKVLESFEKDLETKIIESKELEEKDDFSKRIASLEEEISTIKKEIALNSRGKDILAVEKDKEVLKNYNDMVNDILHRQKYKNTPSQVYHEIESILGGEAEVKEEKTLVEEPFDMSAYKIDFIPEVEEPKDLEVNEDHEDTTPEVVEQKDSEENSVLEEEPKDSIIEEDKADVTSLDDIFSLVEEPKVEEKTQEQEVLTPEIDNNITPLEENNGNEIVLGKIDAPVPTLEENDEIIPAMDFFEDVKEFPPRVSTLEEETPVVNDNRHKVVGVEDLNIVNSEEKENDKVEELASDDVMINDFEDTDYISFNDLLEGDSHGSEN